MKHFDSKDEYEAFVQTLAEANPVTVRQDPYGLANAVVSNFEAVGQAATMTAGVEYEGARVHIGEGTLDEPVCPVAIIQFGSDRINPRGPSLVDNAVQMLATDLNERDSPVAARV